MCPETRPAPPHGWDRHPNLRRRPHAPAAGRGSIQRAVRQCLAMHAGVASSTQLYDFAHARRRLRGQRLDQLTRWGVLRVAQRIADRISRAGTRGRPWLWRLRTQHGRDTTNN
jgi:hypothetical protein